MQKKKKRITYHVRLEEEVYKILKRISHEEKKPMSRILDEELEHLKYGQRGLPVIEY